MNQALGRQPSRARPHPRTCWGREIDDLWRPPVGGWPWCPPRPASTSENGRAVDGHRLGSAAAPSTARRSGRRAGQRWSRRAASTQGPGTGGRFGEGPGDGRGMLTWVNSEFPLRRRPRLTRGPSRPARRVRRRDAAGFFEVKVSSREHQRSSRRRVRARDGQAAERCGAQLGLRLWRGRGGSAADEQPQQSGRVPTVGPRSRPSIRRTAHRVSLGTRVSRESVHLSRATAPGQPRQGEADGTKSVASSGVELHGGHDVPEPARLVRPVSGGSRILQMIRRS